MALPVTLTEAGPVIVTQDAGNGIAGDNDGGREVEEDRGGTSRSRASPFKRVAVAGAPLP